jgi:dCTP diphosphatase
MRLVRSPGGRPPGLGNGPEGTSKAQSGGFPRVPRSNKLPRQIADLVSLRDALRAFAAEREWDQFHSPKNLASALTVEAGELLEHFQWLTTDESRELSPEQLAAVERELADVLIYLVRLADVLEVDLLAATSRKIVENEAKYPAEVVQGRADKYSAYE